MNDLNQLSVFQFGVSGVATTAMTLCPLEKLQFWGYKFGEIHQIAKLKRSLKFPVIIIMIVT